MKRLFAIASAVMVLSGAYAQAGFSIQYPVDGSTVRETFYVKIPKASITQTGFVGIWINGKFIEAVAPVDGQNVKGDFFTYKLDSKAMAIPDGKLTIECVNYAATETANRILGKSSVEVYLDNHSSIRVPGDGFKLRYNMTPGNEYVYNLEFRQIISNSTDAQIQLNREQPIATEAEHLRYRYTNVSCEKMPNGTTGGVVMMQALPEKGKDYVFVTLQGESEAKKYDISTLHPIYMKVDGTGREDWGTIPFYSPLDGSFGEPNRTDLYALFPLPVLPISGVSPGKPLSGTGVVQGNLNLENILNIKRFTSLTPGSTRLEGIEWERGLRCAKMHSSLVVGDPNSQTQGLDEVYWFALDKGCIIKVDRKITFTQRVRETVTAGAGGGGGAGGSRGPSRAGASAGGTSGGSTSTDQLYRDPQSGITYEFNNDLTGLFLQTRPGGGGSRPGRPGGGGGPSSSGTSTGTTRPGGGAGGSGGRARNMRVTVQFTLTLE